MADKLVYSSDTPQKDQRKSQRQAPPASTSSGGPMKMRLEKKGRGGKSVTVLFQLPFAGEEAKQILRNLKDHLGTGGSLKNGQIEIQGDVRDRAESFFAKQGQKVIRAGG